ncbi:MAG TPA: aldo/keto reductase [Coriobacteriia bacterium]|nr:aldo/keto reductase [Coriobacteriia bacterium]
MQYRVIGKTGVKVSALGFGAMRLPIIDGKSDQIDYPSATELLHHAIECGVNYVDTAYFYHAREFGQAGESEPFLGEALSGGWRDRVLLTTKLPVHILRAPDQMETFLAEQLARLRTDHVDFYLLHGLNGESWDRCLEFGALEFLDEARERGLIRFPAFSFHGELPDFKRIVDAYDWGFAQVQYNYMDVDYQAGQEGLRYAADKGMGVVVMEPLKGGKLANVPEELKALFAEAGAGRTAAEWALRYVWNEPGVSLVLSGMNATEQVDENVAVAERALPESLLAEELAIFERVRDLMQARIKADCTACGYCQPCPSGVDIPRVIAALNKAAVWDDPNQWTSGYLRVEGKASVCTECGQCEEICPQGLPIRELMAEAIAVFGE